MPENMNRHLTALEFDKILERLAQFTACPDARELALSLRPESDIDLAQAQMNQTRDAHMLLARFGGPSFGGLRNVNNAAARAGAGSTLSMRELLDVAEVLRTVRALAQWRSTNAGVETVLDPLFSALQPNKYLETKITSAIISEEEIADSASPELFEIRRKIRVQESKVRDQLDKMTHSAHYSKFMQENIITQRNGRYVVPVKAEYRGEVQGLVHDTSSSGATVFVEPMPVVEANNEIKVLRSKEQDEIERILTALSAMVGEFEQGIKNSYECAVELNVIFAKAQYAYSIGATVPLLNSDGEIELRAARHPLIDKNKVVPVDIRLGTDFDTLVITGPNTGGKTVSIKTVGLFTLMAMCGLMIPAGDRSRLSVFDEVLADIGDEQSIDDDLSTYSSHLLNMKNMLAGASNRTLVLIDEFGSGTEPIIGGAIAESILERLRSKGCYGVITTHYANIKYYASNTEGIANGAMMFDVQNIRPLFRLEIGKPGSSFAVEIARKIGLPEDIIRAAGEKAGSDHINIEKQLREIARDKHYWEQKRDPIRQTARKVEELEQTYAGQLSKIRAERQEILKKAKLEAQQLIADANRQIENTIRTIREAQAEKELTRLARRELDDFRDAVAKADTADKDAEVAREIERIERRRQRREERKAQRGEAQAAGAAPAEAPKPREVEAGSKVRMAGQDMVGVVQSVKGRKAQVAFGQILTTVDRKMLTVVSNSEFREATRPQTARTVVSADISARKLSFKDHIDVRGMRAAEALDAVQDFIDDALMVGVGSVSILHGKGTGALKEEIRRYLRTVPEVESARDEHADRGGAGITIVTFDLS